MIQFSKASLVAILRGWRMGRRVVHCHRCVHVSLASWHKIQFQSGWYRSGLRVVWRRYKSGSSSINNLAEKAFLAEFLKEQCEEESQSLKFQRCQVAVQSNIERLLKNAMRDHLLRDKSSWKLKAECSDLIKPLTGLSTITQLLL